MKIALFHNLKGGTNLRHCHYCRVLLSYLSDGRAFSILENNADPDPRQCFSGTYNYICIDCLKELRSRIEALSVLVQTGIDTQ